MAWWVALQEVEVSQDLCTVCRRRHTLRATAGCPLLVLKFALVRMLSKELAHISVITVPLVLAPGHKDLINAGPLFHCVPDVYC